MIAVLLVACASGPATPASLPAIATADPDVLRLVALGDTGHGNATQRRVARGVAAVCAAAGCDAVLLLGDNLYPRGATTPDDARLDDVIGLYAELGVPVYGVLGNHDWGHGSDHDAAANQLAWARDRPWLHLATDWIAEAGPATLFGLDTTRVFWDGSARAAWLTPAVDRAAGWRVVLGHHPLRSNGPHGNAGAYEGWSGLPWLSGAAVGDTLTDAVCGRADLYLAGHDHSLQWIPHCGAELVVSGAGSSATTLEDRGNTPRFARAEHGFVWIRLGSALTVAVHDADGAVLHRSTVPRPDRTRPP